MAMGRAKANVTIQDVAKAAGVSVSTVSRVLNDKDDVAPETYERVRKVIEELNYTSSLAAKSMRSRRMNVIGLIMPDVGDPFSIQVMKGVSRAIAELDYDLIVYTGGEFKKESSSWTPAELSRATPHWSKQPLDRRGGTHRLVRSPSWTVKFRCRRIDSLLSDSVSFPATVPRQLRL